MQQASVAIFKRSSPRKEHISRPFVSDEVFETAKLVAEDKVTRTVQTMEALYCITYSEAGPFKSADKNLDWMPILVYRLEQWSSGGITTKEMEEYNAK